MLEILIEKYGKTKWPYFNVNNLINEGIFDASEANQLYLEGKIRVRPGMHGKLIELLTDKIDIQ